MYSATFIRKSITQKENIFKCIQPWILLCRPCHFLWTKCRWMNELPPAEVPLHLVMLNQRCTRWEKKSNVNWLKKSLGNSKSLIMSLPYADSFHRRWENLPTIGRHKGSLSFCHTQFHTHPHHLHGRVCSLTLNVMMWREHPQMLRRFGEKEQSTGSA